VPCPGHARMELKGKPHYEVDEAWDEHLHGLLGAAWPCPQRQRFDDLMTDIGALLSARGLAYGRHSYGGYSAADRALGRAAWCTVLHTQPEVVIETGVGGPGARRAGPGRVGRARRFPAGAGLRRARVARLGDIHGFLPHPGWAAVRWLAMAVTTAPRIVQRRRRAAARATAATPGSAA
jgi:hypothetical protein